MSLIIPDDIIHKTNLTEKELKVEIAVMLFERNRFTLGQASDFSKVSRLQFQKILAKRQIPIHYSLEDLEDDVKTLETLNRK